MDGRLNAVADHPKLKEEIKMKGRVFFAIHVLIVMMLFVMTIIHVVSAQSALDCSVCHNSNYQLWMQGKHSQTQGDIAKELAEEWIGQPPDSVIHGSGAENCIACHAPIAVTVDGGMTEVQALEHFFTTDNGVFSQNTVAADTLNWPHVFCTTCHNLPADHPTSMPVFSYFNSTTAQYDSVGKISSLCGQCHGALRFKDTDHLTYNAWKMSKHSLTQDDVAGELAEERTGESPDSVILGSDPENCIACHGPTAVLANGGMTETEALDYFFTTQNGKFFTSTASTHQDQWPDVSCITCHNPHNPEARSYFNSETGNYEVFDDAAELCGQCHGSLRFPDTDHRSYNIEKGVGAVGVNFIETMPGITCTSCHMSSGEEDTNASMYHGHTWGIFVTEEDGSRTASCTSCHQTMDATAAENSIQSFRAETQARLDSAEQVFQLADSLMQGNDNAALVAKRDEAKVNLFLVNSDESGGFHNQHFQLALLADVIQRSNEILNVTSVAEPQNKTIPKDFALLQNYPNPFNPSTTIEFTLPYVTSVTLQVYTVLGQEVETIMFNKKLAAGVHRIPFSAINFGNGVYIYKLTTPEYNQTRKMIVMK